MAYADHGERGADGALGAPSLKPAFNHELLLSCAYMGRALVVRTAWLRTCLSGDPSERFDLPWAYRLALVTLREGGTPLVKDAEGNGWFPTGDVATIDAEGFMQITDRSKDVIKSGGEWISSIDVENIAMAHPAVAMAACVGMRHPKWDERPIVVVVKKPGAEVSRDELLAFYEGKIAKWQIPDDVAFVPEIPHTATGKIQKLKLREMFKDHRLPGA